MSVHPDLPDTLVHFTGRPRRQGDEPPDFARGTAEERMVSILHGGVLRGARDFWADAPVLCFSEVTETARRVMLRDGVGGRGPYAPWGVVLDRQKLIQAGARPVLYLSREEMQQTRHLPTPLRNRRVRYDPGYSDWLHEREWRLCFDPEQTPELAITSQLVVGVIVGSQGWMPPSRQMDAADAVSEAKALLQTARAQMKELKAAAVDLPGSILRLSVSGGVSRTKFAGAADRRVRWYWDGEDLVPDGVFDVREQQRCDLLHDDQGPSIEISLKADFTSDAGDQ
ncbi:hypothetical protein [Streptomyces sp. NPDC005547]|uniref:hypothetical protein n=1 Tax=Streptomyces sp. NPDC005547 TaxID=3154887 RepID=UPI0033AD6CB8